jgi:hypothetical protein
VQFEFQIRTKRKTFAHALAAAALPCFEKGASWRFSSADKRGKNAAALMIFVHNNYQCSRRQKGWEGEKHARVSSRNSENALENCYCKGTAV